LSGGPDKFQIPHITRSDWTVNEAGLALEEGKYLMAIRELAAGRRVRGVPARKPKGRDAGDIINAWIVEGLGVDAGESSASSD
jgi:hypothetical protein